MMPIARVATPPHIVVAEEAIDTPATWPLTMGQRLKFDLVQIAKIPFPATGSRLSRPASRNASVVAERIRHYSIDGFDRERSNFWQSIRELR